MEKKNHTLRITSDGTLGGVILDGKDLSNIVSEVRYIHRAGAVPEVTLVIPAALFETEIDTSGETVVDKMVE